MSPERTRPPSTHTEAATPRGEPASSFTLERDVERAGSSYLMSVRLGEVGRPPAGEYQDVITIDVTAE